MDAVVAEAVKDRRSLKGLGNRPIKAMMRLMPVFGISFDAPSKVQADRKTHSATMCEHHRIRAHGRPSDAGWWKHGQHWIRRSRVRQGIRSD